MGVNFYVKFGKKFEPYNIVSVDLAASTIYTYKNICNTIETISKLRLKYFFKNRDKNTFFKNFQ